MSDTCEDEIEFAVREETRTGIVEKLKKLMSDYADGTPEREVMQVAIDAAESWLP